MKSGEMTGRLGLLLTERLQPHGIDVLYDHGGDNGELASNVGRIASWLGEKYEFGSRLALLDIAVVQANTGRALALIEIEETSSTPKTIIGDAFGALMGDRITFKGERELVIGEFTSLVILLQGDRKRHGARMDRLRERIESIKDHIPSENSVIDRIYLDVFSDEEDLRKRMFQIVEGDLLPRVS